MDALTVQVSWQTEYLYEAPARSSHNELRVIPLDLPGQQLLGWQLRSEPHARRFRHTDPFGNHYVHFDVLEPHVRLVIALEATVRRTGVSGASSPARVAPLSAFEMHMYRMPTERTPYEARIRALAQTLRAEVSAGATTLDCADALTEALKQRFQFLPGVTDVDSSALHILAEGAGVCQDFTHLFLAIARVWGIPCRYVGGYLASLSEDIVTEAAHAWAQVWDPEAGWIGFDAANGNREDLRYVIAAVGRDYLDAAPVKGVYRGSGAVTWTAKLTLSPLSEQQQQQQQ